MHGMTGWTVRRPNPDNLCEIEAVKGTTRRVISVREYDPMEDI